MSNPKNPVGTHRLTHDEFCRLKARLMVKHYGTSDRAIERHPKVLHDPRMHGALLEADGRLTR